MSATGQPIERTEEWRENGNSLIHEQSCSYACNTVRVKNFHQQYDLLIIIYEEVWIVALKRQKDTGSLNINLN